MQTLKLDDIGMVEVIIDSTGKTLDITRVNNRLAELQATYQDKTADELNEAVVSLIEELGYPKCSHFVACAFAEGIALHQKKLRDELKKVLSGETSPGSPDSTTLTPSGSEKASD